MLRRGDIIDQPLIKLRLLLIYVPHLQEHEREALHRAALQHDRGILPVAEAFLAVDVLVSEIHAAVEGDLAVYDHDLAVIPVVVV